MANKKVRVNPGNVANPEADRWFEEDLPGASVQETARKLNSAQAFRLFQGSIHQRLYENAPTPRYGAVARPSPPPLTMSMFGNRVTLNVVKSALDAVAAKISKNKARIEVVTSGGNWSKQREAKGLSKWIDGAFYGSKFHRAAQRAFIDAGVEGTGCVKIWGEDGEIKCERVFPSELIVNDAEAVYGNPRNLYQRTFRGQHALLVEFGDDADNRKAIESAAAGVPGNPGNPLWAFGSTAYSEMVEVIEAWHLPREEGADDGRHVIAVNGHALVDEGWKLPYFPFAILKWQDRLFGYWGRGLAEELSGLQMEINQILRTIQRSQALMCVPRVYIEKGSSVNADHLTNEVGGIVYYTGQAPTVSAPQGVSPELYQHLITLYTKAFEIAGVSMLNAAGTKPAGLNSGVSLREYNDIASERFVIVGQRYEDFHLDAALLMIDIARDMYSRGKSIRVKAPGSKFIDTIDWKDVDPKEDEFVMRPFPVSALPSHPAGRLEKVMELLQSGMIPDKAYALKLLDMPDLEGYVNLETASLEAVNRQIEGILEDGKYQSPEPYQDLNLARTLAQKSVIMAQNDGYPKARLELMRRYIDDCDFLLKQATPPPAPPAPAGGPVTAGPPEAAFPTPQAA